MLHVDRVRSKKMFRDRTEAMSDRRDPGPGPVLTLLLNEMLFDHSHSSQTTSLHPPLSAAAACLPPSVPETCYDVHFSFSGSLSQVFFWVAIFFCGPTVSVHCLFDNYGHHFFSAYV